jgi:hypothetical protein
MGQYFRELNDLAFKGGLLITLIYAITCYYLTAKNSVIIEIPLNHYYYTTSPLVPLLKGD